SQPDDPTTVDTSQPSQYPSAAWLPVGVYFPASDRLPPCVGRSNAAQRQPALAVEPTAPATAVVATAHTRARHPEEASALLVLQSARASVPPRPWLPDTHWQPDRGRPDSEWGPARSKSGLWSPLAHPAHESL